MIVLGLLLILLTAGAAVWLYLALSDLPNGGPVNDLSALGVTVGLSPLVLLLTGVGLTLLLMIGLSLIRGGIGAKSRQRRERKQLERDAEENRRAAEAAAQERLRAERVHNDEVAARETTRHSITEPVRDSSTGWRTEDGGSTAPPPPSRR